MVSFCRGSGVTITCGGSPTRGRLSSQSPLDGIKSLDERARMGEAGLADKPQFRPVQRGQLLSSLGRFCALLSPRLILITFSARLHIGDANVGVKGIFVVLKRHDFWGSGSPVTVVSDGVAHQNSHLTWCARNSQAT